MTVQLLKLLIAIYPFLKEIIFYGKASSKQIRFRKMIFVIIIIFLVSTSVIINNKYNDLDPFKTSIVDEYLLDNNKDMEEKVSALKSNVSELLAELDTMRMLNNKQTIAIRGMMQTINELNITIKLCRNPTRDIPSNITESEIYDKIEEFNFKYKYRLK